MQISARADYALRALCVLATAAPDTAVKAAVIAEAQAIPRTFLDQILTDLRRSGIVDSRRGPDGGHKLARPSYAITVADVVRAVDGPLALVRGELPESLLYAGPAEHLREVWIAVRAALRQVLERTSLEQIVADQLPPQVTSLCYDPTSWTSIWGTPDQQQP